ncbi:unnamed protein product [Ambrosiozyma monospora]|uniref:Unnamed protein product n=1 Tax=Ambrosiozyma monospora TaxID=43982 RepID=A0A9W6YZ25_AMBMO|nr:unnamed protein product [Ambrosiozyma monospora]
MFTSLDNCNVDTYDNDQLFCELYVLHCFENVSNIEQSESPLDSEEITVEKLHKLFPNVTTYLREKSKMNLFDPDEEHRDLTTGTELLKKQEEFEKSKLLKTLNYSIATERGWLFITDSGTVISFFENTGEEVEERVFFDFLRSLRFHGEMKTDEFACFENILSAFSLNLKTLVKLYQSLLYRFKVDLNTNASTKRLQQLYLMIDELSALKLRVNRLAKMVNVLMGLSRISRDGKSYMLDLDETLEELGREVKEMMDSIKNLIDLTFNQVAANTNKYMSLLALVSMVFLPMSFFASYYGMNYFQNNLHHIGVFWAISVVVTVVIVCFVGFQSGLKKLSDSYQKVSNSYNSLRRKTAEFKRKRKMIKQERQDNATAYSATTQSECSGTDVLQARSSTGDTVRSISSISRQRNSTTDVNFNISTPEEDLVFSTTTRSSTSNDYISANSDIGRRSNLNVDIQNQTVIRGWRSPDELV